MHTACTLLWFPVAPEPGRPGALHPPACRTCCRCKSSSEHTRFIQNQPLNRGSLLAGSGARRAADTSRRRPSHISARRSGSAVKGSSRTRIPRWRHGSHYLAAESRARRTPAPRSESPGLLPCGPISSASIRAIFDWDSPYDQTGLHKCQHHDACEKETLQRHRQAVESIVQAAPSLPPDLISIDTR